MAWKVRVMAVLTLPILIGLNSSHEWNYVWRASPWRAFALTTKIGVIDLNTVSEFSTLLALFHDLEQLMFDEPCGFITDA
jgi:hypothetical protein